jgi:hypothetical protein
MSLNEVYMLRLVIYFVWQVILGGIGYIQFELHVYLQVNLRRTKINYSQKG